MYRTLTEKEIGQLSSQGCRAERWSDVSVAENFSAAQIFNCCFRGRVSIGENVTILNIGSYIANYAIGDNVRIENCGVVETVGSTCFGNGEMVAVVNEAGGREVPIFNRLTAQLAYLMAMYRHRTKSVRNLYRLVEEYCRKNTSDTGAIGQGAVLTGCRIVRNVNVGPHATLEGLDILSNVSVNSTEADKTYVGVGVKAYDSIFSAGSTIDNGSVLKHCFVGEACVIDYNYTAEHSLFFANSHCANGEACSIFAGPYTVSHHKSTLLIAGIFSFFNAGSGSNQSNHLFKTGPVHQGVHERGCKFSSDAYVMLPAREGAFSIVLGRHTSHHDTALFPFSYLTEDEGKSYLVPAACLRSYGTVRDLAKWPQRNRRNAANLDIIRYEEHNPFIAGHIAQAIDTSEKMLSKEGIDTYVYNRVRIKQVMVRRGLQLYRLALAASIGEMLRAGREAGVDKLPSGNNVALGTWVDLAGMFAPKTSVELLLDRIESGRVKDIALIAEALEDINAHYVEYAYRWAEDALEGQVGSRPTPQEITDAIARGQEAIAQLKVLTDEDARRDRDIMMSTGYGIDSDSETDIASDYAAVRGLDM